jgi:hypothetical protein
MNKETKQQAARQAPIPPPAYIKEMVDEIMEPKLEPGEQRDKVMMEFAQSDAYDLLKEYIESQLRVLAGKMRQASEGTTSLEEVGYRYMVTDAVNKFAMGIISFVESPLKIKRAELDTKE